MQSHIGALERFSNQLDKLSDSLGIKIARQGKVGPLITGGGLKSDGHNVPIGLKSSPVGSAIQIAKRRTHFAARTEGRVE